VAEVKIGLVVNPIAGMGGAVGLKGTDGDDILSEARRRGAVATASARAREALAALSAKGLRVLVVTCAGDMGEEALRGLGMKHETVYIPNETTTANDTRRAVEELVANGVELVLFCGGDGTARDVVGVIDAKVPVVGIPAGVKMHSSVFAVTPTDSADLVESYINSGELRDAEVMDVDEDDFRQGMVRATLYGFARVPDDDSHLQPTKSSYHSGGADAEAEELGTFVADEMMPGVLYLLGPGSTTGAVARALKQDKTPLGVDAYLDRMAIALDISESGILELVKSHPNARIVVTPIGSQGFVFGRGNQQLSPAVIRLVGADNIVVVATPTKLKDTPLLRVDTGDAALDSALRRPVKVVTGYKRRKLVKVG
jgi:predicted polyphosphate/ATP-dependent NAD kinase